MSKTCTACGVTRPFTEFYFNKGTERYVARCKECAKAASRAYGCSDAGKRQRRRRDSTAEARARRSELGKRGYDPKKNAVQCKEYAQRDSSRRRRQQREAEKRKDPAYVELLREYARQWRKTEDGKKRLRVIRMRRRARKFAAGGRYTAADIEEIYKLQRGRCAICRKPLRKRYHVDHIKPLSKGGSNARANIQLACPVCNVEKHDKDPIQHMQDKGKLL